MYRFLLTPRWLGIAALTGALIAGMVLAGRWQLDRYQDRSATNARIADARTATPTPLQLALAAPTGSAGSAGPPAPAAATWSRVTMTGRYDLGQEILVRGRTLDGRVGFEVLTPLRIGDKAVLVDRGWIRAAGGDATTRPAVPTAPTGEVTVTGRIARSESGSGRAQRIDGRIDVRRISVPELAAALPYPLFGAYVLLDPEQPGGAGLTTMPSREENAWLNGGYTVQWWLFALLTFVGFCWLVRREARGVRPRPANRQRPAPDPVADSRSSEEDTRATGEEPTAPTLSAR